MSLDTSMLKAAEATLTEKKSLIDGISANFKTDDNGNFEISPTEYKNYVAAVKDAKEAKNFVDAVHEAKSIEAYLDAPATQSEAGMSAGMGMGGDREAKSLADVFMGSQEFKSAQEGGFKNVNRIVGELEGKSIHALTAGSFTAQSLGSVQHLGMTERATRKTRIRDLFPKSSTKASVLHGVIEQGWVNNAKQVRQRYAANGTSPATGGDTDVFGHKPKSKITLRNVLYPVATIAHTLDAHKNILDDEPRLRTFLNMRMAEGVKYAEDYDLLHSIGSSEEITGLFNVTGVQNYTGKAEDKYSVQIRRAITKAQLAEYDPTGIVISPEMWEHVEVEEDGYGGFRVAVNVAVGAVKQVWHLDVACTTAMSDDNFLIGAFGLGAQLHDREAVNVTMSTENNDNFERNVVTFRAEERLALEVPRPESFVVGSWTTPTP
jgi:HK97 family phage major capsid protein